MDYAYFFDYIRGRPCGDSEVVAMARIIVSLARWPTGIIGWMERDVLQFVGTAGGTDPRGELGPEQQLTREQGQELLAASERAFEVIKQHPEVLTDFIRSIYHLLDDDEAETTLRILRTLHRLVTEGRLNVRQHPMEYAGFAWLFHSHLRTGVTDRLYRETGYQWPGLPEEEGRRPLREQPGEPI